MNRTLRQRRGTTAIELALVIPVLFGLLFAAIDFARVQNIRDTASLAAYEGARQGILPGKSAATVREVAQENIDALGVLDAVITVTPSTITDQTPEITVSIDTPLSTNLYAYCSFFKNKTIHATCSLKRESELTGMSATGP
ncbi:TadE/TadG family type IV pilus assembly protein [Rubripirellula reticaptiva]|nr:TadE/TadG family type IV pilus assembly protein [Rubripirellula reticaptiva]